MKRLALLIVAISVAAVPLAQAGSEEPYPLPGEVEPAPVASAPALIPFGVSVAGIPVGGMTSDQATTLVEGLFGQPLRFQQGSRSWATPPSALGASGDVQKAVSEALVAAPGTSIVLDVDVDTGAVRSYVSWLDSTFSRAPKDASLRLVGYRPRVSQARSGFVLARTAMTASIVFALRHGERGPLDLEGRVLRPKVPESAFRSVVVIRRGSKKLYLYRGESLVRRFGVATGQAAYPTPLGHFEVVVKWRNPWWYPPASDWAKGQEPAPPGPGNPLGTRWMGLSAPLVGIHGTPDSASIGYSASHGCIRMLIADAEWLFERVQVGTPVFIVGA